LNAQDRAELAQQKAANCNLVMSLNSIISTCVGLYSNKIKQSKQMYSLLSTKNIIKLRIDPKK